MRTLVGYLFVVVFCQQFTFGQDLFIVGKGGVSSYGSVFFNIAGPASGDQNWKSGPILGVGVRLRTSKSFALEGLVEYSTHRYAPREWENPPVNNPKNSILEFSGTGRLSFGVFEKTHISIIGGVSISSQVKDELVIVYANSQYKATGRRAVDLGGILGIGLEVRLSKHIEISLEGSWRMRFYVTPVTQLGLAYGL